MSGIRAWRLIPLALLLVALAACSHGGSHAAAKASAKASARAVASAFATNPATRHDQVVALNKLAHCSDKATSGQITFTVDDSDPAHPQVTNYHYSLLALHHLRAKSHAMMACAFPKSIRKAAEKCAEKLGLPVGGGAAITAYLIKLADCGVGAPQ